MYLVILFVAQYFTRMTVKYTHSRLSFWNALNGRMKGKGEGSN